jgi:hypothetical protein
VTEDRLVYIDDKGKPVCVSANAIAAVPSCFSETLLALTADLDLAMDCLRLLGGIPLPVAKAILRNLEPAHAALDMAMRSSTPTERLVH